MAVCYNS